MQHRHVYRIHGSDDRPHSDGSAGRASRYAVQATENALRDAGLYENRTLSRIGVILGTGMGDVDLIEASRTGGRRLSPVDYLGFQVAASVANQLELTGPNVVPSTACSAGSYSLSLAHQFLADGLADVVVAGGTEVMSRVVQGCFNRMDALDPVACRPFAADRAGAIYGEGAAVLVLETASHALDRGRARWYGVLKGEGWSCDGHHPTAPEPSGRQPELALRRAAERAALPLDQIDCIVAHGTGTALNDGMESACMVRAFGLDRMAAIPVCAIKSKLGHSGGASGAFGAVTAALILANQIVPPTANLSALDPNCHLNLVTAEPLPATIRNVLVNAYAFGGNNISLLIGRD